MGIPWILAYSSRISHNDRARTSVRLRLRDGSRSSRQPHFLQRQSALWEWSARDVVPTLSALPRFDAENHAQSRSHTMRPSEERQGLQCGERVRWRMAKMEMGTGHLIHPPTQRRHIPTIFILCPLWCIRRPSPPSLGTTSSQMDDEREWNCPRCLPLPHLGGGRWRTSGHSHRTCHLAAQRDESPRCVVALSADRWMRCSALLPSTVSRDNLHAALYWQLSLFSRRWSLKVRYIVRALPMPATPLHDYTVTSAAEDVRNWEVSASHQWMPTPLALGREKLALPTLSFTAVIACGRRATDCPLVSR